MFEHIWDEKQREGRIKKEQKRLSTIFRNIDEDRKGVVQNLISSAAFQSVLLEEMSLVIKRDGFVEEYQNGANQCGFKKSATVEAYDKSLNTYSKIIKQLCELIPNSENSIPGAELMNFIKGK